MLPTMVPSSRLGRCCLQRICSGLSAATMVILIATVVIVTIMVIMIITIIVTTPQHLIRFAQMMLQPLTPFDDADPSRRWFRLPLSAPVAYWDQGGGATLLRDVWLFRLSTFPLYPARC